MNVSAPFIKRPIGTSLLTLALLMSGALAFSFLPVAPLPEVEFPVIQVSASLPGASPETMASAVATPLERQFGRIAGINQMTSVSQLGATGIVLQFDLNRNIDAAARDVQAAINAARSQLPSNLPGNPWYRKVNPADAPILIVSMTSDSVTRPDIYDQANSILSQKLSQVSGVGQVYVAGGANPAVRAELDPNLLNKFGIGLDAVRVALGSANANRPKGEVGNAEHTWTISDNDQMLHADQYRPLVVAYNAQNGAAVRLGDVGTVEDSVEDAHIYGLSDGKPAVLLIIFRQPGANIIQTVDNVLGLLPQLEASISPAIKLTVVSDRTITVRASLRDIEITLVISVILVILVVFVFLRTVRATIIPSIAVPLSLVGTFGVMYLLHYSLNNLSSDGAGHFDRLCGGRCHRSAGKHYPLSGTRDETGAGGVPGGARNRLYRALDEHFAGGGVHPDSNDGRYCRTAVPGICGHLERGHWSIADRFSYHDPNHVRAIS